MMKGTAYFAAQEDRTEGYGQEGGAEAGQGPDEHGGEDDEKDRDPWERVDHGPVDNCIGPFNPISTRRINAEITEDLPLNIFGFISHNLWPHSKTLPSQALFIDAESGLSYLSIMAGISGVPNQ